jgi:hypothetical protein
MVATASSAGAAESAPAPELQLTDSVTFLLNVDNRNSRPGSVQSTADDDWSLLYNRTEARLVAAETSLQLRVDSAWFPSHPSAHHIASELVSLRPPDSSGIAETDASFARRKQQEAEAELSSRYISWLYPAKYSLTYSGESLDVTVGDSHAQFGRGLVLSLRRSDELGSDTTLRGVRLTQRWRLGPSHRLQLTALGGSLNPLRLDLASGRSLTVSPSVTSGWLGLTEAGMPRAVPTTQSRAAATYAPDRLLGAQLLASLPQARLGTQGVLLLRQESLSAGDPRLSGDRLNLSQSIEVPHLGPALDAYLEAAVQRHATPFATQRQLGQAFYASMGYRPGPLSLMLEAKHYRSFEVLAANTDQSRAFEFAPLQYSQPPSTLPSWADYEFGEFNSCTTGARLVTRAALGRGQSLLAALGRYASWAESVSNPDCRKGDARRNDAWDASVGWDGDWDRHLSRADLTLGGRLDDAARPLPSAAGTTTSHFYREAWLRGHAVQRLSRALALQLQTIHRWRQEALLGNGAPWWEGEQLAGLEYLGRLTTAFGFEYDTSPQTPPTYLNAQVHWKAAEQASLALFVGQRRGALRCVAGVCRQYPPFEGVRLDGTMRF